MLYRITQSGRFVELSKRVRPQYGGSLEDELSGPRSNRREVNVSRLTNVTKNDEVVIVPGKMLGAGAIGHKLTVCAFSISAMKLQRR